MDAFHTEENVVVKERDQSELDHHNEEGCSARDSLRSLLLEWTDTKQQICWSDGLYPVDDW